MLMATASIPLATVCNAWSANISNAPKAKAQLAALEKALGGRLGVFALNTADGLQLAYRGDERFPVCSTFKLLLASAILQRSTQVPGLMQQRVNYLKADLAKYSPISENHVDDGMTVEQLCAAALQHSDNTAANLLIKMLGGTAAVTEFARSIGDTEFRLDRMETELNSAIPGDPRDTSTPMSMANSLNRLALGDGLEPTQRAQLQEWLRGNTTGDARIRSGVPKHWKVGDKTGSGDYGTANDIAVLWPTHRAPVVVAIYTTQNELDSKLRNDVIASAARIVVHWIG
jgi:beta-lactamase class A